VIWRTLFYSIVVASFAITLAVCHGCGETIEIERASFSGRVVDESKNPVSGRGLYIISCDVVDHDASIAVYFGITNDTGHFIISGIYPGQAQLMLLHEDPDGIRFLPEYEILSVSVEGLTFYPNDISADPCAQATFLIPSGARIENVEVIVQQQMPNPDADQEL